MGTDIHLYVEYNDDDEKWHLAISKYKSFIFLNSNNRHYPLFTILSEDINISREYIKHSISKARGIPQDTSEEYKQISNQSWTHTHSYHTLAHLKEFNWKQRIEKDDAKRCKMTNPYIRNLTPTYAELAGLFYQETMPKLKELAQKYGGDDNVRIVFFFDN